MYKLPWVSNQVGRVHLPCSPIALVASSWWAARDATSILGFMLILKLIALLDDIAIEGPIQTEEPMKLVPFINSLPMTNDLDRVRVRR